jgi:hypothetical protein
MKNFLNNDMQSYQNLSENQIKELRHAFKNSVVKIRSLFDKHAFKRFYAGSDKNKNGYWETKKFNASLFDILMSWNSTQKRLLND